MASKLVSALHELPTLSTQSKRRTLEPEERELSGKHIDLESRRQLCKTKRLTHSYCYLLDAYVKLSVAMTSPR